MCKEQIIVITGVQRSHKKLRVAGVARESQAVKLSQSAVVERLTTSGNVLASHSADTRFKSRPHYIKFLLFSSHTRPCKLLIASSASALFGRRLGQYFD
jgi:hypothetical protein